MIIKNILVKILVASALLTSLITFLSLNNSLRQQSLRQIHIFQELQHHCINDEYNENLEQELEIPPFVPEVYEETVEYERKQLAKGKPSNWRNMKILLDYSNLNVKTTSEYKDFIQNRLMNYAEQYISRMYKVFPTQAITEMIGKKKCGGQEIPLDHQINGIKDYDLVIYVSTRNAIKHPWLSASQPCQLSKKNHRAVSGSIVINTWYLSMSNLTQMTTDQILQWQGVLIHETTHILGFMSLTWKLLERKRGIKIFSQKDDRYYITNKKVKNHAKKYWNCDHVYGAPLENNGGKGNVGSHWEKSSFSPELMTGSAVQYFAYTKFTVLTLEATRWYIADMNYVSDFVWGKDQGCSFAKAKCGHEGKGVEFCSLHTSKKHQQCSADYMGVAHCHKRDKFSPHCGLWDEMNSFDCRIQDANKDFALYVGHQGGQLGGQSNCFDFKHKSKQPSCYVSQCEEHAVTFTVENKQYKCKSGKHHVKVMIAGKSVKIRCPNHKRFCLLKNTKCKQDCNQRGNCRQGKCYCYAGFLGDYCEQKQV